MIKNKITDGRGSSVSAHVTKDHALLVTTLPYDYTDLSLSKRVIPFRQYFTIDGTPGGTFDMRVDGSGTPIDFYITASNDAERYITVLSFVISDSSATPAKFGTLNALTNGVQIFYTASDYGNIYIHDSLKTNFQFMRLSLGQPPLGSSNDAFRISNVVGNADSYIPFVDLARFVPPNGVLLKRYTNERIIIRIQDDITGVDGFDCVAFGYDLVEVGP